jgi:hypothetical protein
MMRGYEPEQVTNSYPRAYARKEDKRRALRMRLRVARRGRAAVRRAGARAPGRAGECGGGVQVCTVKQSFRLVF